MGKDLELTWHKPTGLWRKRYQGKDYYFAFGESRSDRQGYRQALDAWKAKKAELETGNGKPSPNTPLPTIRESIAGFLKRKEIQAEAGERSLGRFDALRCHLECFQQWITPNAAIDALTSKALLDYHSFLIGEIRKGCSRAYARDRMQSLKQLTRWCWELELIDLPRNIESNELAIKLRPGEIQTFTDDEIKKLLQSSVERTRLYILLMLNSGMQQEDLSSLHPAGVDWEQARLIRKRSKTKDYQNVPTVNYLLWPETFRLLGKYRSQDSERLLLNQRGTSLRTEVIINGKVKRIDNVRSAYRRAAEKLGIEKPLKLLRKTSATKLASHPQYGRFASHFLGHSPATIAERHYIRPSQDEFDKALLWLAAQFSVGA